jgi:pyruvate dehydrogenase E1 component
VSDNLKLVADQIAPWIPGGLMTLGTDGFGRSEVRPLLRRFFEIDAECTTVATLYKLSQQGTLPAADVAKAIRELGVDPEKTAAACV